MMKNHTNKDFIQDVGSLGLKGLLIDIWKNSQLLEKLKNF